MNWFGSPVGCEDFEDLREDLDQSPQPNTRRKKQRRHINEKGPCDRDGENAIPFPRTGFLAAYFPINSDNGATISRPCANSSVLLR